MGGRILAVVAFAPALLSAALSGCDTFVLADQFYRLEPAALTLEANPGSIPQGESADLHARGGTAPHELALLAADFYFDDGDPGTVSGLTYTASDSIGTVTIGVTDDEGATDFIKVTILPAEPGAFAADGATGTPSTIELTWTFGRPGIDEFRIERSTTGAAYVQIAAPASGDRSFTDTDLSPNTAYEYRIFAVAGNFDSPPAHSGPVESNQ